mmetsp:Transcript_15758/g.19811  ORF Transcript_15758/g.19811 Transcript_15758/m.19811 type:complete len:168 (-) Transcript_15758:57-560(-)
MDKMQANVPQVIQVDAHSAQSAEDVPPAATPTPLVAALRRNKSIRRCKEDLLSTKTGLSSALNTTKRGKSAGAIEIDHDEENLLGKFKPKMTGEMSSILMECPRCLEPCRTKVKVFYADISFIICTALFFLCLWCVCWLPFCLARWQKQLLKDCQHRCPTCLTLLAH